jgi:hypothetical protein
MRKKFIDNQRVRSIIKRNMYNALIVNKNFFVNIWPVEKIAVSLLSKVPILESI